MTSDLRAVTRIIPLDRGLYALHYSRADDVVHPPRVMMAADPDGEGRASFLFAPHVTAGILRRPSDMAVVSVDAPTKLIVTILVSPLASSDNVVLKVDRLNRGSDALPVQAQSPTHAHAGSLVPLRISAHLEGRGDVVLDSAAWVGEPGGSSRIEGLAILWPGRPMDVDIAYSVSILGRGRSPEALTGGYVGTRGQALPVNGVFMKLVWRAG